MVLKKRHAAMLAGWLTIAAGIAHAQPATTDVHIDFVPHPDDSSKRIEIVWTKPAGDGRWPVVVLVHGHQDGPRIGARMYIEGGGLQRFAATGYLVAAVSQPGYGRSDGPPDFCGPRSQNAVLATVAYAKQLPGADARRVALYGYSRGAVVSAMAATRLSDLSALILGGGIYDLKETFPRLAKGIQQNIRTEAGSSDEAFRLRSPLLHVDRIKAPTLVLHGELDDRASADSARRFGAALQASGATVRVVVFPGAGHGIPRADLNAEVNPFLQRYLAAGK